MSLPIPEAGLVICYAYLWRAEHRRGVDEGVKNRPCAIVLAKQIQADRTLVTVVPVTHREPDNLDEAVEIPLATKRRLGLDPSRSWVIVNEVNRFVWPGVDLRPVSRNEPGQFDYGVLPPSIFNEIKAKLLACAKAQRLAAVNRTK